MLELPTSVGGYRWYYLDLTAGEVSAVVIFMIGGVFSSRAVRLRQSGALPTEHAAINFALYRSGKLETWVLSEYSSVDLDSARSCLRIGRSTFTADASRVRVELDDFSAPFMFTSWGRPVRATLTLERQGPAHEPLTLVSGRSHRWQPIAAYATASLELEGTTLQGRGYHDTNWGDVALGDDLEGWSWSRTHRPTHTEIHYAPWGEPGHHVCVDAQAAVSTRSELASLASQRTRLATQRTRWGLAVPAQLDGARPSLLESSPFYARLECAGPSGHTLGEVADFARFLRPSVRWMSSFKTRRAA